MLKSLLFIVLGLVAGIGISQIIDNRTESSDDSVTLGEGPSTANTAALTSRVAELEARLAAQAQAREVLADQLAFMAEELALIQERMAPGSGGRRRAAEDEVAGGLRRGPGRFTDSAERAEQRQEALVAAGFGPDQAAQILRREGELRMDAMYRRYEAMRGTDQAEQPATRFGAGPATNPLREELGDADYDRYLYATGQPNRVRVAEVIETSPGAQAGLAAGDMIVSYGGARVFNFRELISLTSAGEPGEMVAVEVVRDGSPTQLYLPRGPIGMVGGRRARVDPSESP